MLLYRGLSEDVWTERFKLRGYPPEAAREMAGFLVGRIPTPPNWRDLLGLEHSVSNEPVAQD